MSTTSCLVTGGTGFVGARVVEALLRRGDRVTVLGRKPAGAAGAGEGAAPAFVRGDLESTALDLGGEPYQVVYHVAGLAHVVPRTDADRRRFHDVNVKGTERLLEALGRDRQLPEAFVLVSTVAVYGADEGRSLDEDTPRRAADPYGVSKREAEDVVLAWGRERGVRTAIARLPLVAGGGAPGNLGAMVRALRRKRYLGVGDGAAQRSMVMARDVAEILPKMAETGGTYNLTDGHHPTFAELEAVLAGALRQPVPLRLPMWLADLGATVGDRLQQLLGRPIPLNHRTLGKMTSTLTFDDRRAREALGWRPSRVVDCAAELVA
ncbi:NAD-dependent epimerase/dehydratase family protein [Sorangium cellulosum]|uniref:NAD-dependent epimerase/dehydratase family protein n=1 Tax=Sorangium cellulosum TaxID=56 RepID=UPI0007C77C32|nr:NAD-dependent epimerase/dehydratase family protein [Sorangium cellulosum]